MTFTLPGLTLVALVAISVHSFDLQTSEANLLSMNGKGEIVADSGSWGLSDAVATAGMIFQYNVSLFRPFGVNTEYKVSRLNSNKLPAWLEFDEASGCLIGVPGSKDADKTFHLQVICNDKFNASLEIRDVFSVDVITYNTAVPGTSAKTLQIQDDGSPVVVKCLSSSHVTSTTVVIDAAFDDLLPSQRMGIVEGAAKYLGLSVTGMRLTCRNHIPPVDETTLVTGPGNVEVFSHVGTLLQWKVGCGNVFPQYMAILQKLEVASKNGDLSFAIGYGITSWYVTDTKPASVVRLKRRAQPVMLATTLAVPTVRPPDARTSIPTVTVVDPFVDNPLTRVVPSLTSSAFSSDNLLRLQSTTIPVGRSYTTKTKTVKPAKSTRTSSYSIATASFTPELVKIQNKLDLLSSVTATFMNDNSLEPSMVVPKSTDALPTENLALKNFILTEYSLATQNSVDVKQTPDVVAVAENDAVENRMIPLILPDESVPFVNSEIGTLTGIVGKVFKYKIPEHLFSDSIDGNTPNLTLAFLDSDGSDINVNSWIKYDNILQALYGLPLNASHQQYFLSATNKKGRSSKTGFYINILKPPKDFRVNFLMSVILDMSYDMFINDVSHQIDVASKISHAFGDEDESKLMVTRISSGSVEYVWTNSSLSSEICPIDEILLVSGYFIVSNGSLNSRFVQLLKPYVIKKAKIVPQSSCRFLPIEALVAEQPASSTDTSVTQSPDAARNVQSDFYWTILLPVLIIASLFVLAIIIACILCLKRRQKKPSYPPEKKPVKRGAPVIFTEELEDKLHSPSKPLIMEHERPPQPPDYLQGTTGRGGRRLMPSAS